MDAAEIDRCAKVIWDFHLMHQKLRKADVLLVAGSYDIRVAEYAAGLFKAGWAPLVVCSGGIAHQSDLLKTGWDRPEAEVFAERVIALGVPKKKILIEDKSINTGQNFRLSKKLLEEKGIHFTRAIAVQTPFMERRAYGTGKVEWPRVHLVVTSPHISFEEYPTEGISKETMINLLVGDLQRIKVYGESGIQIPMEIPEEVWNAFETLVKSGFDRHLIH